MGTNLGLPAHVYECLGDHRVCRVALLNLIFDDDDDVNQEMLITASSRMMGKAPRPKKPKMERHKSTAQ